MSLSLGGSSIVQQSIDMGTPIIYVSMNYRSEFPIYVVTRLSLIVSQAFGYVRVVISSLLFIEEDDFVVTAFGFLAGAEVKAAGVANLGLRDRTHNFCLINEFY